MRRVFLPLVVLALGSMAATAASASAATTCNSSGTIKLSPGLTNTPTVQNVTVKSTLSECSGESGVTGGTYVAHLKTAEGVTCAALTGSGALVGESKIVVKVPGTGNSMGTFTFPVTELSGTSLGGSLEKGPFAGDAIGGSVSQTYTGGPTCGVAEGKKKAKKVSKGTFTGSLTF